jgi:replicative DNA helicase
MDVDAVSLWFATKSVESFKKLKEAGVDEEMFTGTPKEGFKFISEYFKKHGELPGVGIVAEEIGCVIRPPEEGDEITLSYLANRLHERSIHRALKYGLIKSQEALEEDKQDESVSEVLRLADHLRKRRVAQVQVRTLSQIAPEVLEMYERTKRGEIGIPLPWPTMTAMTLGLWPGTLSFFVARPGVGKCVHEDTSITDPVTGIPRTIRQIYEGNETRVASWSKDRGIHVTDITAKVDTGKKSCLRFTFRTGRSIIATPEHPFLSPDGWVRADSVSVGQTLAQPKRMPMPEEPVALSDEEVDLLASYVADEDRVHESVWRLPGDQLSRFLSKMWSLVSVDRGFKTRAIPEDVARAIQSLLLRVSVQSCVERDDENGWVVSVLVCSRGDFLSVCHWVDPDDRCADHPFDASEIMSIAAQYGVDNECRWWWDSDIFWDVVTQIEHVGEQKIYDLSIAGTHCFVANDIIVHNTWTAVIIAMHAWAQGKKVLIVSPELGRVELGERLVAKYGRFSFGDMVTARLGSMNEGCLREAIEELKVKGDNLVVLDDEDHLSSAAIEQTIETVEPDIVLIDSIYMMKVADGKVKGKGPGSGGGKGGRYDRILETVDWLRSSCRRYKLPFVGISQLSRDAKQQKKSSDDEIKKGLGTGGLEDAVAMSDTLFMDAHNLFALYQDPDLRVDKKLIYVPLKVRRQASMSHVIINWDMTTMEFEEIGKPLPGYQFGSQSSSGENDYESIF